ncbi:hypothetical protein SUGI_0592660 [Cryptomeria japonica]|nr:hypothetical protein SUGI_0592660 [Cryptomeria japonica]
MASSSSQQQNQGSNAFLEIESDSTRRKVCESSRLHDVFINHRGPDVKTTLASQLYNSLKKAGIRAFLDSEEKELGVSFPSTIETAIKSAKVHVAIFSKRYAESPWCLAELVLMLQTKARIIPVFYQVKPSDLRFIEKGDYPKAFAKYVNKKRYIEKLSEWKEALQSLSFVAGEEFKGDCKNIIAAVRMEIQKKICLHVAKYPVGLDDLVQDFERRCLNELVLDFENQCGLEEGKHKAKGVGIFGMGGAGKTTLAKELFNLKCSNYSRVSFLFDVREGFERRQLPFLQLKLLNDLFQDRSPSFISTEEGTSYLKDRIQRSPSSSFLIVVDDIDHVEQLNALMIMDILNKFDNTLVIVTTRNVGVLINAGITSGYHLKGVDRNNGRQLFCWHAFGKPHSSSGYGALVDAFVDMCGGLPLSLRVLGRHVHGKPHSFWRSALVEAKRTLARDVKQTLRISFDALGGEEKQVFMDIACFFVGRLRSIAERVWEGSGWNARHALETLKDKCLVEETEIVSLNEALHVHKELELRMHDHLRDLGREMAFELHTPLRWWRRQDLEYLESMVFKNILAKANVRCFHSIFDESMSCQVTFFLGQSNICVGRPASLLWLELEFKSTEQIYIPSWVFQQNVHCLKIKRERLETFWENGMQAPTQLKELHIYETFLEKIPDMSGISNNLGKVVLDAYGWPIQGLSLLESLNMNLCSLSLRSSTLVGAQASTKTEVGITCESLVIWNFKFSQEVAWNNGGMSSSVRAPMGGLEKLEISCEKLVSKILISGIHYPSLESIKLHCMLVRLNISECPELEELSLGHLSCLERMTIVDCKHLKSVSGSYDIFSRVSGVDGINNLAKLVELEISDCGKLEFECLRLSGMRCLEAIIFDKNMKVRHLELNDCQNLKTIEYGCKKIASFCSFDYLELEKLLVFVHSICLVAVIINGCGEFKYLQLIDCQNLKSVSGKLEIGGLYIDECPKLEELPRFSSLSRVEQIHIESCGKLQNITLPTSPSSLYVTSCSDLQRISTTGDLTMLTELYINQCPELEELPSLSSLSCVEKISIQSCGKLKLQNIMLPTSLTSLCVSSCSDLQRISATGDLTMLTELYIIGCPELAELPSLSNLSCVEKISIQSCGKLKLQNIMLPTSLTSLYVRSCTDLQRVSTTSDVTKLTVLYITECPELEELPNFSSLNCMEDIYIKSCGKLQNIMLPKRLCLKEIKIDSSEKLQYMAGIEELYVTRYVRLRYCSNALVRNCIDKLKSVPEYCVVIGRAVDGAESSLTNICFLMQLILPPMQSPTLLSLTLKTMKNAKH